MKININYFRSLLHNKIPKILQFWGIIFIFFIICWTVFGRSIPIRNVKTIQHAVDIKSVIVVKLRAIEPELHINENELFFDPIRSSATSVRKNDDWVLDSGIYRYRYGDKPLKQYYVVGWKKDMEGVFKILYIEKEENSKKLKKYRFE